LIASAISKRRAAKLEGKELEVEEEEEDGEEVVEEEEEEEEEEEGRIERMLTKHLLKTVRMDKEL
jgi:hypothetical protein